ncbi:Megakaryocyte-associated tyrosine-protein kinase, partial [Tolypocladium paradoxum]
WYVWATAAIILSACCWKRAAGSVGTVALFTTSSRMPISRSPRRRRGRVSFYGDLYSMKNARWLYTDHQRRTGLVVLDSATQTVIKTPFNPRDCYPIQREREVYERLAERGRHQGTLSYHGEVDGGGIRLEFASKLDLQSFIQGQDVDPGLRLRWIIQLADTLAFIHDAGIIHGDLTTANVFLDDGLNARLADFAGSSIDLSPLLVEVTASHLYPGNLLSAQGDIFALGSVIYEVTTGKGPYAGLSDASIRSLFQKGDFPDVTSLGRLGDIIRTCWGGGYEDSKALVKELKG